MHPHFWTYMIGLLFKILYMINSSIVTLSPTSDYEIRCRPAHGFHHVLSLTGNMSEFTRVIKRQRISGNMDTPEGGLDAMLQAAVCQVCICSADTGSNTRCRKERELPKMSVNIFSFS